LKIYVWIFYFIIKFSIGNVAEYLDTWMDPTIYIDRIPIGINHLFNQYLVSVNNKAMFDFQYKIINNNCIINNLYSCC